MWNVGVPFLEALEVQHDARCRKCSFVLIDIKVRILLTFLASKCHLNVYMF